MLLTDADQLREALAIALRERDEARAALRTVAERQREACAVAVDAHGIRSEWGTVVRATPLVTEGDK